MFIKIIAVPDIPVLDKVSEEMKKRFIGLKLQARRWEGFRIPKKNSRNWKKCSRTLESGQSYYAVNKDNLLGAALDSKKAGGLYVPLSVAIDMEYKVDRLIFGPNEVQKISV
jgi:hypothetical protein